MLLDDEAVAAALELAALWLLRFGEVALAVVGREVGGGHGLRPFACLFGFFLLWRRLLGRSLLRLHMLLALCAFTPLLAEALLQRGHQVDHVRALRRSGFRFLDDLLALALLFLLDEPVERV